MNISTNEQLSILDKRTNNTIFNLHEYDPFIDFLKGICILFVVFTHCFPNELIFYSLFPLWGSPAVPLFLIVQVFHTYKKGIENTKINYTKLWQRIIKPFFFMELVISFCIWGKELFINDDFNVKEHISSIISWGGIGPGSYYPWIYIQFVFLLPLVTPIFKHFKGIWLAFIFILISEMLEIFCCIKELPEYKYRLIFFRYTFLIYLGYILTYQRFNLNKLTLSLSIISIIFVILFNYTDINWKPFFFNTDGWKSAHWICYIYIVYLMIYLIKLLYYRLSEYRIITSYLQKMGRYSYEIFLFQMFYFGVISEFIIQFLTFLGGTTFANVVSIPIAVIACIIPVIYYRNNSMGRHEKCT